jgi:hypothetical protein
MELFIFDLGLTLSMMLWPVALVILILLLIRRIRNKKTEDFEDRDN